jgi:hypothetical protein
MHHEELDVPPSRITKWFSKYVMQGIYQHHARFNICVFHPLLRSARTKLDSRNGKILPEVKNPCSSLIPVDSCGGRLRFDSSFGANRGNYHGFNSMIWLYVLLCEPLALSVSNECDRVAQIAGYGVGLVSIRYYFRDNKHTEASTIIIIIMMTSAHSAHILPSSLPRPSLPWPSRSRETQSSHSPGGLGALWGLEPAGRRVEAGG